LSRKKVTYLAILVIFSILTKFSIAQNDSIPTIADTLKPSLPDLSILSKDTVQESVDSMLIYYFYSTVENLKTADFHDIDTSLTNTHQFNPLEVNNGMYSTLSNIGLAHNNIVFTPETTTGYDMRVNSFDKYIFTNEKVKYYKLYIPHSPASWPQLYSAQTSMMHQDKGILATGFPL